MTSNRCRIETCGFSVNIAVGMTATQSSTYQAYYAVAGNVVNGCTGPFNQNCCSHTDTLNDPTTAWWRVDLGQLSTIKYIRIFYREKFERRFGGYHLYLANTTTSAQDGILCYEDKSSTREEVQLNVTHQCPYVARYVTIYNYRNNPKRYDWYSDGAILELCEVEVSGCHAGWYGDGNCENKCPGQCKGGNCDSNTGFCFYCLPGKYGDLCDKNCSTSCSDSLCDKGSAQCTHCIPGKYGNMCDMDCSTNCRDGCDETNGFCTDCIPGKYGNMCDMDCSTNCRDGCDKTNGFCTDCISGKHADVCDKDCSTNCRDNICDKDTANCFQCEAGFYGNKCDTQCDTSCKTNTCYQNSGECIAGAALSVTCGPGARPDVCYYPTTTSCTGGTTPGTMVCRCNQGYFDSNGYSTAGGICTPMSNLKVTEVKPSGAVGSTSVTITWTPPSDSSQISSYSMVWRVSGRANVAGSFYAGKSESATITGLTPGTSYVFTVKSTETGSRATPQEVESDSDVIIQFDASTCTCTGTSTTPWIAACGVTSLLTVLLAISSAFFWNRSRKSTGKHKEETPYDNPERVYANTEMSIYALTTEDDHQVTRTGTGDEDYSYIGVYNTAS